MRSLFSPMVNASICLVFGMIALISVLQIASFLPSRMMDWNFNHYYLSSYLLLNGQNPYTTPMKSAATKFGFVVSEKIPTSTQTPAMVWLMTIFALMPIRVAFWIWVMIQTVCLGIILCLAKYLVGNRVTNQMWLIFCCLVLASNIVACHFFFSQVQFLLAALLLYAYSFYKSKCHRLACLAVIAAGALKIFPLALLPWFIWRDSHSWRDLFSRIEVSILGAAIIVLATGLQLWNAFFAQGFSVLSDTYKDLLGNFSIPSLFSIWGLILHNFSSNLLWFRVGGVIGLGIIVLSHVYCWYLRTNAEFEFCLLSVAMLLGSSACSGHYFVLLIYPAFVMYVRVLTNPAVWSFFFMVGTFILLDAIVWMTDPSLDGHLMAKIFVNFFPLIGLMALGGFFVKSLYIERQRSLCRP